MLCASDRRCRERRQPTPLCACPPLSSRARAATRARAADTACVRLTRHLCLTRTQRLQLDIATPGDAVLSPKRCRRRRGCCKPEQPQITRPECALLPQLATLGQRHIRASSAQPATLAGLGLRAELLTTTLADLGLRAELLTTTPFGLGLRAELLWAAVSSAARDVLPVARPRATEQYHRAAALRPAALRAAAAAPAAASSLRLGRHHPAHGKSLRRWLARLGGGAGRAPRREIRDDDGRGRWPRLPRNVGDGGAGTGDTPAATAEALGAPVPAHLWPSAPHHRRARRERVVAASARG